MCGHPGLGVNLNQGSDVNVFKENNSRPAESLQRDCDGRCLTMEMGHPVNDVTIHPETLADIVKESNILEYLLLVMARDAALAK